MSLAYGIPVDQLQQQIDSRQFTELWAYHSTIEPIGGSWQQTGTICETVVSIVGSKMTAADFIPINNQQEKVDQMQTQLKQFAMSHNAKKRARE